MACARLTAAFVAALAVAAPADPRWRRQRARRACTRFTLRAERARRCTPSRARPPSRGTRCRARRRYQFELSTSKRFSRQRLGLVDERPHEPRRLGPDLAALDDRQPVLALRARPRNHAQRREQLERSVRVQHALVGGPGADHARPTPACSAGAPSRARTPTWSGSSTPGSGSRRNTNMADEREYYTLHQDPAYSSTSFTGACGRCAGSTARPRTASRLSRTAPGARSTRTTTRRSRPGR